MWLHLGKGKYHGKCGYVTTLQLCWERSDHLSGCSIARQPLLLRLLRGLLLHTAPQRSTPRCSTVLHTTLLHSAPHCSTPQCSTLLCSTVLHTALHHSAPEVPLSLNPCLLLLLTLILFLILLTSFACYHCQDQRLFNVLKSNCFHCRSV